MKKNEFMAAVLLLFIMGWAVLSVFSPQVNAQTANIAPQGANVNAQQYANPAAQQYANPGETKTFKLTVQNGLYYPREITVNQGDKVRIEFDQKTFTGCMTTFNIYDLGIRAYVPNTPFVEFTADKSGAFRTGCNMGMGDGRIIVQPADGKKLQAADASPLPSTAGSCGAGCGCGG